MTEVNQQLPKGVSMHKMTDEQVKAAMHEQRLRENIATVITVARLVTYGLLVTWLIRDLFFR